MMLLAFANRLDALLNVAQRCLHFDSPGSRWAGLFKRAQTVITQQATRNKGDLLCMACRAIEAANATAAQAANEQAAKEDEAGSATAHGAVLLQSLHAQCKAWDSKIKSFSTLARTMLDPLPPIISGQADLPDFLSKNSLARTPHLGSGVL